MDRIIILIANALSKVLNVAYYLLFARAILSWFPIPYKYHKIIEFLYFITEPILAPIRKLINRFSGGRYFMVDFSPIIAFFLIMLLQRIIWIIASLIIR